MKTRLSIVMMLLFVSSISADISLGLKGGFSLFKVKDSRDLDYLNNYRSGPDISIFSELGINDFLFYSFQFNYYQAGGEKTYSNFLGEFKNDFKLDYIGFGFGLQVKAPTKILIPYVIPGISFDFLCSKEQIINWGEKGLLNYYFNDENYKNLSIRPFLTAGLECRISNISLVADYTFTYNIVSFYSDMNTNTPYPIECWTYGHLISMGLKFYL